ncbi:minor capsid protein [Rathayibacter sp. AY1A4]|uniref:minor capsid protein n=1 Tax=Rathayibacter sp. AY1A4 TaxID=2080522 RepID=UPI002157B035|nr:minor capsid protein [Rathayibacter sp. AY1A4]
MTKLVCAILGRLPGWAWREHGPAYTAAEVGIFYGPIDTTPDRAIGVRVYGSSDSVDDSGAPTRRVQLTIRGEEGRPDGADHLAHFAFLVLHGRPRGGGINGISRTSMGPLGADDNGREQRSENYTITLDNPEASE